MSANLQKRSASQQPVRKSARISLQQNNAIFGVNQERKEEKQVRKEAAGEEVREASVVRNSSLVNGVLTSTTRICFPNSCSICFERFSTSGGDAKLLPIGDFCAGHFVLPEEVMEQQQGGGQKNISQLVSTNPFDDVLGQSDYPLAASFVAMFDQWSMLPPNSLILRGYSLPAYSDAVATQMLRQCCESCFLAALQARIESNLPLIKFPVNLRQFKIFCPLCPRDSNNAITHIDLLERSFTACATCASLGSYRCRHCAPHDACGALPAARLRPCRVGRLCKAYDRLRDAWKDVRQVLAGYTSVKASQVRRRWSGDRFARNRRSTASLHDVRYNYSEKRRLRYCSMLNVFGRV
jgi:hypothetical protein